MDGVCGPLHCICDTAAYPPPPSPQLPLPDLLKSIVGDAERVDGELRNLSSSLSEAKTALTASDRKRTGNLSVCALEGVLTPAVLAAAGAEFFDASSEYFATLVCVVPKVGEEAFLGGYENWDGQAVPVGPLGRRDSVRSSPVVPKSARRVTEDKDGYVLYTVTILKRFADSFKAAAREKRVVVREFSYAGGEGAATAAAAGGALEDTVAGAAAALKAVAGVKYGEALAAWLHVKAVRVFVEAVLRFGLPVSYTASLWRVEKGAGKAALDAAFAAWRSSPAGKGDNSQHDTTPAIPGVDAGSATPFVWLPFDLAVGGGVVTKA